MGKKKMSVSTFLILMVFLFVTAIVIFPLYALLIASFKPGNDLVRYGLNVNWDLAKMSLNNYTHLFGGETRYFTWYKNSLVITSLHVLFSLFLTSTVAYSLAMYRFKLNSFLFTMVIMVMMVPVEILMLPLYQMVVKMNLVNSYAGVILPFVVVPTCIFFFRQYLSGIPRDFLEAARIDGCSEYGIYFKIFVPLMQPAFTAMLILQAMNCWNNLLWPMLVLRSSDMQTLPIGLKSLITPYGNNYDVLVAGAVMAVVPVMLIYVFFQRYFIEGMTAGGVKG